MRDRGCRRRRASIFPGSALRVLLRIALPALEVPRVLGIDGFALAAASSTRPSSSTPKPGGGPTSWKDAPPAWSGTGSAGTPASRSSPATDPGAHSEAVRPALPDAVRCGDRWHLRHLRGEAAAKEIAARSACWAKGAPLQEGKRAETTRGRWQQVRSLRAQNAGLLGCSRRLNLSLNTVKRYDRAGEPERLQRVPQYRPALAGPHRGCLRQRRAEEPGVPVQQLLREIRERGFRGSSSLLARCISQGRLDNDHPHLSPRRAARILLTRPDNLTDGQRETAAQLSSARPEPRI